MKRPSRKAPAAKAQADEPTFAGWVILELMGHRKLAGLASEVTIAGAAFLRLDIPSDPPVTQFYGGAAIYCLTPTTEELARQVAAASRPAPVSRYELPAPPPQPAPPTAQEIEYSIEGPTGERVVPDDDWSDE